MNKNVIVVLLVYLGLVACAPDSPSNSVTIAEEDKILNIGDISNDPLEKQAFWQPLADYLENQLADEGIVRVEVAVAPDLGTMIHWLKSGEVDLYFDSPYPVIVVSEESGAEPILRRFKGGVGAYHSVIFVRDDSEFKSIEDLQGHIVALEENYSTSGYMLPITYMMERKLQPVYQDRIMASVPDNEIGFTFSGDDDLTVEWVLEGVAPAGVVDSTTFSEIAAQDQDSLRIIAETEDVPRQMAVVRSGLNQDLVDAIYEELITMDESEEGVAILEKIKTTQFEDFPEGIDSATARMKEMYALLYAIGE